MTRGFHGNQMELREETKFWATGAFLPLTGDPSKSVCGWNLAMALSAPKSRAPNAPLYPTWDQVGVTAHSKRTPMSNNNTIDWIIIFIL